MLNPHLYEKLRHVFRDVRVVNENQPMRARPTGRNGREIEVLHYGESYEVECPICRGPQKLRINHRWGTSGGEWLVSRMDFMVKCFRKECQVDGHLHAWLRDHLTADGEVVDLGPVGLAQAKPVDNSLESIPLPRNGSALHQLPAEHPAVQMLTRRGHDVHRLGTEFGVGWFDGPGWPSMYRRLIFPSFCEGLTIWQGRYVDAAGGVVGDDKHVCFCSDRQCGRYFRDTEKQIDNDCPTCGRKDTIQHAGKWRSPMNLQKSFRLWNLDTAKQWPFVIVTEGPLDVCKIGRPDVQDVPGPSVALMGKTVSPHQRDLLCKYWAGGLVIVALDADALPYPPRDQREEREVARWQGAMADLRQRLDQVGTRLVLVELPAGEDPGSMPHEDFWHHIDQHCMGAGVDLMMHIGATAEQPAVGSAAST